MRNGNDEVNCPKPKACVEVEGDNTKQDYNNYTGPCDFTDVFKDVNLR